MLPLAHFKSGSEAANIDIRGDDMQIEVQTFGSPSIDLLDDSEQHYFYGMLLAKVLELCE